MKKRGFTLSEMLVALGVIAVLAMILIPVLKNARPNEEKLMFKKAYYIIERCVSELINDEDLYPDAAGDENPYFGNTIEVSLNGKEYSGDKKFCELVATKLNLSSAVDCSEKSFTDGEAPDGNFTTSDGMVWILPIDSFQEADEPKEIYVDVNGKKAGNCFYNESSCQNPDRFTVKLYQNGRIVVDGEKESEYLSTSNVTKE